MLLPLLLRDLPNHPTLLITLTHIYSNTCVTCRHVARYTRSSRYAWTSEAPPGWFVGRLPATRCSTLARLLMRKHDLLRILSLAGTLSALEAASLLIQLRSQDRTLFCPPLCHVQGREWMRRASVSGIRGCAAYSCPWPSRRLGGRPEAWSCHSSAFGGLPSDSADSRTWAA